MTSMSAHVAADFVSALTDDELAEFLAEARGTDYQFRSQTMTDQPTPRELREGVAQKLAQMPHGVDANGWHNDDRQADADRFARFAEAYEPADDAPTQTGMKPNPSQGHGGTTVPAPAPRDPLAAIRAQAAKHTTI